MSILGNRVLRKEDPKFLTVGGSYVDDMKLDGCAYVTYVRSTVAHALILSIDVALARDAPGVIDVVVGSDVDLAPMPPAMRRINQAMARPWLATDRVRFVGEPIVAIITERRSQGVDAAELVEIDYEPLQAVIDVEDARRGDDLLFPDAGTNVAYTVDFGRDESLLDGCEVVVRQQIVNSRVAPCPLEGRSTAASWAEDGRLTVWTSTQSPHGVKTAIAKSLGLAEEAVHVICPDVGGGFGAKGGAHLEEMLIAWLARRVDRPLKWTETRSESMVALGHGRAQYQVAELGGRRDGTFEAYRLTVNQDSGAYPSAGAFLPFVTRLMASGVYEIPRVEFSSISVVTNTTPIGAYRGAGRPEATAAIERIVDVFAAEIGMDPAEVRRKNLIANDAFPYTTRTGAVYDCGNYVGALDLVLASASYDELRAEQRRRREAGAGPQLGIGLAVYVEVTGGVGTGEYAAIEVLSSGRAVVRTGTSPHGQGHVTSWAMLASAKTGIPIEMIDVIHGDTDLIPQGGGTSGSRSLQHGGVAVDSVSAILVEKARALTADLLEANPDDVVLDHQTGDFTVVGSPAVRKTWAELATLAEESSGAEGAQGLSADGFFAVEGGPTFPFGAHIAVVEVDLETGKVTVERIVAVDDAGTVLNPLIFEGQIHGGLAQGVAQALLEEVRYDEDGNPLTTNFADYSFITAQEVPNFETVRLETPTPINSLGAKGVGESGTIGSTPAVQNAVVDALAHLGVRHVDMPTTPEKVWKAVTRASQQRPS